LATHKWDGLHTRHLLESTHTNTHKQKQTHNLARESTVRTHAVAAPSSSEEGASPPPPASRTYRGDTEVHAPKESKANQSSSVKAVDISQHILRERSTGPPPRYIRMATNNLHTLNRRRGRAGFCRLLLWDTLKYSIGLNPHPETLHDYGSKPTIMQVVNHIRT
jgi:hypothetical protein